MDVVGWKAGIWARRACIVAAFLVLLVGMGAAQTPAPRVLVCAFDAAPPFAIIESRDGFSRSSGFDIRLLRAAARKAGFEITFRDVPLARQEEELKAGRIDVVTNFVNDQDSDEVRYSAAYRSTTDVVFVRQGMEHTFECNDDESFVREMRARGLRLGLQEGDYHGDVLQTYSEHAKAPAVQFCATTTGLLEALRDDRIDACIVGRLEGAALMSLFRWDVPFARLPFTVYEAEIHYGFSRRTVTANEVDRFNAGLDAVRASGEYTRIAADYRAAELASVMSETTEQRWFYAMDLLGCLVYALSGAILAHRERYAPAGALLLAALPTVGGGIIRDLMVNRHPIAILRTPVYLLIVFGVVLIGAVITRFFPHPPGEKVEHSPLVLFFDTLGLSAYVIIGVKVAVETQCSPLWLWGPVLAAITGAGGGIVRDMVRANRPNALASDFLAEVAFIWGLFLSLFMEWYARQPEYPTGPLQAAFLVCLVGAFATRWIVLRRGWISPRY